MLWHRHLGHISKDRMQRLIKKGGFYDFDFLDIDICVDCIKGKLLTKVRKGKKSRKQDVLKMIHTKIYGPIIPSVMGGHKCFITFIDDYSRFGSIELLTKKSKSLNPF